ncbi:EF-hand calcium-binding domain-containing protein 14 [Hyla sarda]|uniref:EF-hand calcium-binding domain-containing protein 14 n=1 Tax=Hyla sarda TaxID=327740 RepID=UPI0024C3F9FF|nr:EF-hand calcium-binding domain-containing protein 14 [Hyla sarda]
MKKRKELNALIGLAGDGGRKKHKKGSGHRLLRTEPPASDSDTYSEEDEFSSPGERRGRCGRWSVLQCCRLCYPLCGFIVLAACMVMCIGLVWMQVALKENIDSLKEQFKTMESIQQNSVQEVPKINEDLLVKEKRLKEIVSGDQGLNRLWTNITEVNRQIALLTSAVNQLKTSLKSASDLINLPKTMEELQKSVATLGSTVTSIHHDVETLQTAAEEQRKKAEALQKDLVTSQLLGTGLSPLVQVQSSLEDLNGTVQLYVRQNELRLYNMDSIISNISHRVAAMESNHVLQSKEDGAMVENSTDSSNESRADVSESSKREDASAIRQQLQLIHVLTKAPDSDKETAGDAVASPPPLEKKNPRSVLRRRERRALSLPGISTLQDLEEFFRTSPQGIDGTLSMEDLELLLGLLLRHSLKNYDVNGDDRFSLTELKPLVV